MTSILLAALIASISTGGAHYLHERQHHHDEARGPAGEHHEPGSCALCLMLQMPLINTAYTPVLICFALLVAVLRQLAPVVSTYRVPLSLDCRGPPASNPIAV